jgi:hypothetical protein
MHGVQVNTNTINPITGVHQKSNPGKMSERSVVACSGDCRVIVFLIPSKLSVLFINMELLYF